MSKPERQYLGHGVYVEPRSGINGVILTTENGIEVQNRIVLEYDVLESFLRYVELMKDAGKLG